MSVGNRALSMVNQPPVAGDRTAKYKRRRAEVIAAAAAIFAERGYHGASTKLIAERAGIRQGSLYHYFSSKEAALEEVCAIGVGDFMQGLGEIAGGEGTTAEKVHAAVLNHLSPLRERYDYVRAFVNERQYLPDDSRRKIGRLVRRYERQIEDILRQGVARGAFPEDLDCALAALALLGQCNGVLMWYGRRRKSLTVEKIAETYAAMFLDGVAAHGRKGDALFQRSL